MNRILAAICAGVALVLLALTFASGLMPILAPLPYGASVYCGAPWASEVSSLTCQYPLTQAALDSMVRAAYAAGFAIVAAALFAYDQRERAKNG